MWLPTPIYERTPQLWLLMAIAFVVLALYIGFAYKLTILYLALGGFCAVRGFHVIAMRMKHRGCESVESAHCDDQAAEAARN
jgi:hypothetical protein